MADYNAMSDGELSAEVLKTKIPSRNHDEIEIKGSRAVVQEGFGWISFDINNPADAWPIIDRCWNTLMSVTDYDFGVGLGTTKTAIWDARTHMAGGKKLRAAMIVYLMMMEGE